ncbi:hypothetical protein EDD92_4161 [Streptomyces sp. TLI_185]|nr:hypothetical protein EDD92_4161 [Streptomyces sp. TLI_185]
MMGPYSVQCDLVRTVARARVRGPSPLLPSKHLRCSKESD